MGRIGTVPGVWHRCSGRLRHRNRAASGAGRCATAGKDYRLSGPYKQENLSIYLIHREGRNAGPLPITLGEAMKKGFVKVVETGNVEPAHGS